MSLRKVEDGLTAEEVDGRIRAAKEAITSERCAELLLRDKTLDEKLDDHHREIKSFVSETTSKVESRVESVSEKLNTLGGNFAVLVGTNELPGLIPKMVDNQDKMLAGMAADRAQAAEWHSEDLEFRGRIRAEVFSLDSKVDQNNTASLERHSEVITKLSSLRWLIWMFQAFNRSGEVVLKVSSTGKNLWPLLSFMAVAWVAVLQWIRMEMPRTSAWTQKHSRLTLGIGIMFVMLAVITAFRKGKVNG